ncbi:HECT-domain ubiquitin-transferase [Nitzschia inconspicua]|uniref:HECT-type E3 ubiquitin transferase n=1 Tax=Nitzschia inconspicua TaxID=303405 RepID=A0A9K3LMS7_9STRA|nr:HECT-domain ubiquitin-transferase [Nitzschia inconspicua]
MFDGNFRSARREVDYSGSSNRRGRRDLLKNAEVQRKQRHELLRREKAARLVQRVTRGYLTRVHTLKRLVPQAPDMTALSLCLSYHSYLPKFQTCRKELLLKFHTHTGEKTEIVQQQNPMETNTTITQQLQRQAISRDSRWFSQQRMVASILQELDPSDTIQNDNLFQLLSIFWQTTKMNDKLFLILSTCLQKWCFVVPDHCITKSLMQWSVAMTETLQNPYTLALLATILLSSSVDIPSNEDFSKWFAPLAKVLLLQDENRVPPDGNDTSATQQDPILRATLDNLRNGRENRLLSNLCSLTKSSQLVLLIHYVLSQPQNEKLCIAVALMARGDSLDPATTAPVGDNTAADWDDFDDSDDIDDDDTTNNNVAPSKPSNSKRPRATQYKRQEILTLVKLDKLYHERIQQTSKRFTFDSATRDVATHIVKAPWLAWGLELMSREGREQDRYLETLGILLQASSALRPKQKLTPMSALAFNHAILDGLWKYIQQKRSDLALCMFADLFSHYLVALSDEDFLRLHCNTEKYGRPTGSIVMASDLVRCYGAVLHEVYWSKPVVSYDIEMDNPRGRLILSGTKLWNSLHERWNRLVKDPFCDEDAWWFPHLSSREKGAVVPSRETDHIMRDDDDSDVDGMDVDDNGPRQLSAAEAETDALADSFRDPKMARILTSIPQALPFDRRLKLFHSLLKADKRNISHRHMMAETDDGMVFFDGLPRERITIRRSNLYGDSMEQLNGLGNRMKHQVQVTFVNALGAEEAGIDGGGVFKEFVDDLIKDGFAAKAEGESEGGAPQLFTLTPEGLLSVNLDLSQNNSMLIHYAFLGRVLAKALYEGILVEPQFCLPFLNALLGKVNSMEDLKNYDEEYYVNLKKLRLFTDNEIDGMDLCFELTVGGTTPGSSPRTVELVRNGRSIPVTRKNVFQYTHAVANQLLNVQGAKQTRSFLEGFREIVPVSWVRLFSAKELQKLISGDDSVRGIDVASLRQSMHYLGGYHESQPYIQDFWDILENELTFEQQRKFLRFMTSCSRQPLLGFSSLEPAPSIQQIRLHPEELSKYSRLPTSQTCMNLLKLPNYGNKQLLKEKLIAAVEAGAGFELT